MVMFWEGKRGLRMVPTKPNVIGVQYRKFSLTYEIFHDDFHHGGIPVFKESERKDPLCFISIPRFDVGLIIVFI